MTSPIAPTFVNALDTNVSLTSYPGAPPVGSFQPITTDVRTAITNASQFRLDQPPSANSDFNPSGPPRTIKKRPDEGVGDTSISTKGNVLNDFANYTYHIRFSMVNQQEAYSARANDGDLSSLSHYIIAESGATAAFNISRFSVTNTVGPGFKNQNQNLMTWKMTINEPYGLTLPDYIINAAKSSRIGIKNINRFPFFIELWFTGYDEAGKIQQPSVTRRVWRVMMLDFDLETNVAGTTYNIHGIADNAIGTANQYAFPQTSLQLTGIETFGDAIEKLQNALNESAKKAENRNAATKYQIEVPEEIKAWNLTAADRDKQPGNGADTAGKGTSFPINRGQDLGAFIMTLASKYPQADNFLKGEQGIGGNTVDTKGLGRILQVFTEVELGTYHDDTNDYAKIITLRMIPFYTTRVVATPGDAKKQLDIAVQRSKLDELQQKGLLAKQYDYYYTGLNTEVIKLDVKVENFWAITLPTYLGTSSWAQNHVGSKFDRTSTGAVYNQQTAVRFNNDNILPSSPFGDIANRVSSGITSAFGSLRSAASSFNIGGVGSQFGNMGSAGGVFGTLSSGASSGMNSAIQNLAINNVGSPGSSVAQPGLIRGLGSIISGGIPRFDAQTTNILQNITNNVQKLGFASDTANSSRGRLQNLSASTKGLLYLEDVKSQIEGARSNDDDVFKVAFQVDPSPQAQNATNNGNERKMTATKNIGAYTAGQSIFGQTIGNLYDNKFMLEIELTIKGDPHWIGMTNLEENSVSKTSLWGSATRDRAIYLIGENMFLLKFKTGANYREDTGFMDFERGSDFFNGIYAVLEVENKFENGSFTQDLRAFKELFSQKTSRELTSGPGQSNDKQATNIVPIEQLTVGTDLG